MASSSTQKPSSSSSATTPKRNFDVFLSFRGEDTRYSFTDHLFERLDRMGINTFRDDKLERGEEIAQELLGTIKESRCSIIVFSERYADSKWCLDELTTIMECKKEMGQMVLPVFYHVDPSHVRKQTEGFEKAFASHEINVDKEKVQRWRAAMTEAGSLSGCHVVKDHGYESKYIEEIVEVIRKRLDLKRLHVDNDIVGMDFFLKELKSLVNNVLQDVHVVGIYGIGGIGKTTIAKIVYNEIQYEFNGASFLENVRESFKKGCQLQLQEELLCGTMGQKIKLSSNNDGINIIKNRLGSKKVLIVIDDVDHLEQLKSLVGSHRSESKNWFGAGTRIILTTRDQQLLRNYGVDVTYEAKELHFEEAIQLFSMHAFKKNSPIEGYVNLSKRMIDYAQGLPLALKVLGASLHGMTIEYWKSASDKLKNNFNKEINNVLRISFDSLDYFEKNVFLDIACFFKGEEKAFVSRILDSCKLDATCNVTNLCNKCLITISTGMVQMHDLIQEMGLAIVREECLADPSKWSRLWDVDDINEAFSRGEGMKNIETIYLDLSRSNKIRLSSKALAEMKKVCATMKKLRMLKIYYSDHHTLMKNEYKVFLPKDFEFPPNLIYLHWEGYTSKSLPSNFHGENLVALNLRFSNIKELWKSEKHLAELKFVDLSYSKQLIKIPKFSRMPKLERLNLEGCTSFHNLVSSISVSHDMKFSWKLHLSKFLRKLNFSESGIKELPSSIGSLTSLEKLNLSRCSKFKKFPDIFANMGRLRVINLSQSGIKELPSSIGYLESLEILSLDWCSNFEKFPEIEGKNMKCLKWLCLNGTPIKGLPYNIGCLEALETLHLEHCSNLEKLPEFQGNMGSLNSIYAVGSGIIELPCSMGHLTGLETLELSDCKNLRSLPSSISALKSLKHCKLDGCSNLEIFSEIKEDMENLRSLGLFGLPLKVLPSSIERMKCLEWLELSNSENLETLPNSIGNLTCLRTLVLANCPKLQKLPDSLRSLQCCLKGLDVSGCNLMEGAIPSDLWCLFSLELLDVSENNICCVPVGIIQLSHLNTLVMNHCPILEVIPELPSSLRRIEAHGCPFLENLSSDPTHLLWSNLLNCFKSQIQDFGCQTFSWLYGVPNVVIPGSSGIPEWVSHKSTGREIRIELPNNWYKDNYFLGFALFVHYVPLDGDDRYDNFHYDHPQFSLFIYRGDQFEHVNFVPRGYVALLYHMDGTSSRDPALSVAYFPQIAISSKYRSNGWNYFKACFHGYFHCGNERALKVESCGIHLVFDDALDHHEQSLQPFNVKRSPDDRGSLTA